MRRIVAVIALIALGVAAHAQAAGPDDAGVGFMGTYASLRMPHFADLDASPKAAPQAAGTVATVAG